MTIRIEVGDCREVLARLPADSVHCVVTSPPYWGLRDYGTATWTGGDPDCKHQRAMPGTGGDPRYGANKGCAGGAPTPMGRVCSRCGAHRIDSQLGLEATPEAYVEALVLVFREVWRVLRPDGTLWLNLGDSYATVAGPADAGRTRDDRRRDQDAPPPWAGRPARGASSTAGHRGRKGATNTVDGKARSGLEPLTQPNRMPLAGLKPKDLVGIPWRVAFALQADGWWLRQDIVWAKPNPMPESIGDRCTKSHEYLFLLAKSRRYFYDAMAIAEPVTDSTVERLSQPNLEHQAGSERVPGKTNGPMKAVPPGYFPAGWARTGTHSALDWATPEAQGRVSRSGNKARRSATERGVPLDDEGKPVGDVAGSVPWEGTMRNKRSVWTVTTQPFKEAHFATFPPALIEPCVLAGCPERCCRSCGAPLLEVWERDEQPQDQGGVKHDPDDPMFRTRRNLGARYQAQMDAHPPRAVFVEFGCDCFAGPPAAGVVLDPFGGAGTTGLVADRLHRDAVLVELNPEYAEMAERRIHGDAPLFAQVDLHKGEQPCKSRS